LRLTNPKFEIRNSKSGIALVITLILLAVITFMAVAFLVVTRGGKNNVRTMMEQTVARNSPDAGTAMAIDAIVTPMLTYGYSNVVGLLASTNYISPVNFVAGNTAYTNVVRFAYTNLTPLNAQDFMQNAANLLVLPPVPVFPTNSLYGSNVFQFYVDLNR